MLDITVKIVYKLLFFRSKYFGLDFQLRATLYKPSDTAYATLKLLFILILACDVPVSDKLLF